MNVQEMKVITAVNVWRVTMACTIGLLILSLIVVLGFGLSPQIETVLAVFVLAAGAMGIVSIALLNRRFPDLYALALALWIAGRPMGTAANATFEDQNRIFFWFVNCLALLQSLWFLRILQRAIRRNLRPGDPAP